MENQPMMSHMYVCFGYMSDKLFFYFEWGFGGLGDEPQPLRHPEDMGIYRHSRLIEKDGYDDIGCFAAYARELDQLFSLRWNFSVEIFHQHFAQTEQVLGLIVWVRYTSNIREQLIEVALHHPFRCGKVGKQFGSYHIDRLIRTLGTQNHRYQ